MTKLNKSILTAALIVISVAGTLAGFIALSVFESVPREFAAGPKT
jgi:hypothetical protein